MELLSLNTLSSRKKTVFLNQSNRTQQYHEYSIKDVIYDYYLTS